MREDIWACTLLGPVNLKFDRSLNAAFGKVGE